MIDPKDKTHPRNHKCDQCGARAGWNCRSQYGKILKGRGKQHRNRHYKAFGPSFTVSINNERWHEVGEELVKAIRNMLGGGGR